MTTSHAHLRFELFVGTAVLLSAAMVVSAGDANSRISPFVGKWSMNAAKSKVEGAELPKSYTSVDTDAGTDKLHSQVEFVSSDGSKEEIELTADLSGKPTKITGYPDADAVQANLTKPRTLQLKFLKNGRVVELSHYTISTDGKIMRATEEESATSEHGRIVYYIVFERQ